MEFLEQFNENLLLKEDRHNKLRIQNLLDLESSIFVENFQTPEAFIFIYEKDIFLCMQKGKLRQYNVRTGELISDYENERVYSKSNDSVVPYVAQLED